MKVEKEEIAPEEEGVPQEEEEEEESFLISEKAPVDKIEEVTPLEKLTPQEKIEQVVPPEKVEKFLFEEPLREESMEVKPPKPKRMVQAERRGLSRFFALFVVLVLLVFGVFYVWTELGSGGKLSHLFRISCQKDQRTLEPDLGN